MKESPVKEKVQPQGSLSSKVMAKTETWRNTSSMDQDQEHPLMMRRAAVQKERQEMKSRDVEGLESQAGP